MRLMTESHTFPPPSYRGIPTPNTVPPQLEKKTTNLLNRPSIILLLHTSSHIPHLESTLHLQTALSGTFSKTYFGTRFGTAALRWHDRGAVHNLTPKSKPKLKTNCVASSKLSQVGRLN